MTPRHPTLENFSQVSSPRAQSLSRRALALPSSSLPSRSRSCIRSARLPRERICAALPQRERICAALPPRASSSAALPPRARICAATQRPGRALPSVGGVLLCLSPSAPCSSSTRLQRPPVRRFRPDPQEVNAAFRNKVKQHPPSQKPTPWPPRIGKQQQPSLSPFHLPSSIHSETTRIEAFISSYIPLGILHKSMDKSWIDDEHSPQTYRSGPQKPEKPYPSAIHSPSPPRRRSPLLFATPAPIPATISPFSSSIPPPVSSATPPVLLRSITSRLWPRDLRQPVPQRRDPRRRAGGFHGAQILGGRVLAEHLHDHVSVILVANRMEGAKRTQQACRPYQDSSAQVLVLV
ncbi:hypothetical protein EJB05_40824, partial [Eragrostis curvula]